MKVGDLIRFCGSYYIESNDKTKFYMSAIEREGIICEITESFISVLSEGESCLIESSNLDQISVNNYASIEVVNEFR